jgi:tripartite-type tricarboxylate transporter receptor subunit TctC
MVKPTTRQDKFLMRRTMWICAGLIGAGAIWGHSSPAAGQSVVDFYKGRNVTIVVGSDVGGGYDLNARTLARHLGRHIPGNPNIIVQNKPGASSIVAANYVYEVSPKDGSVIAAVQRPIPFQPLLGETGLRYDVRKIQWLGSSMNELGVVVAWHTAPQRTVADLFTRGMVVGGNGPQTDTELFARALNNILGTKFRIVSGYPGQAQITLAMERGEVQGTANWSWSDIAKGHPDLLREGKVRLLLQLDLKKSPDLPDVPFVMDLARNDDERHVFEILMGMKALGRPYFVAPEVPKARSDALRAAFMDTMRDPQFIEDATRTLGSLGPVSGEDMQKIVADVYALPPAIIARAREAVRVPGAN